MTHEKLAAAIKPPQEVRKTIVFKQYGSNSDIQRAIKAQDENQTYKEQLAAFCQLLPSDEKKALETAFLFFLDTIPYEEDGFEQNLKTPARAFADGQRGEGTDCKTFALIMGAVCYNLGIPYVFRYANYSNLDGKTPRHIYTVANVKGENIILDIPYKKFNKEKQPNYSFDVKGSPVKKASVNISGMKDKKTVQVAPKQYLPFGKMTEGELLLSLQKRQFELVNSLNPTTDFRREIETLENVLQRGNGATLRGIGNLNDYLQNFIKTAATQQQPAAFNGQLIGNAAAEEQRRAYNNCIDAAEKKFIKDKSKIRWNLLSKKQKADIFANAGCNKFLTLEQLFNETLEPSGNAMFYNFVTAAAPSIVETKKRLQSFQSSKLGAVAGLSDNALKLFYRNGVIAAIGAQPEEVIAKMRANAGKPVGAVVITAATITAIAAGISALAALFNSLKKNGFEQQLSEVATPSKSTAPDLDDWTQKAVGPPNGEDGSEGGEGGEGGEEGNENDLSFWDSKLAEFLPQNKILIPTAGILLAGGIYYKSQNK